MRFIKLSVVLGVGLLAFLSLSDPSGVVVDKTGKIDGLINKTREFLQGEKFWGSQLKEANRQVAYWLEAPKNIIVRGYKLENAEDRDEYLKVRREEAKKNKQKWGRPKIMALKEIIEMLEQRTSEST
ncbi:MAG: hypothetical protein V3T17_02450 [Pseudomonadales bacterium]